MLFGALLILAIAGTAADLTVGRRWSRSARRWVHAGLAAVYVAVLLTAPTWSVSDDRPPCEMGPCEIGR